LVVVTSPEEIRIQRIQKRDPQRSANEIRSIMARQLPEADKIKVAHHVVVNDGLTPLIPQLLKLNEDWINAIR
jgi:dephospho-CoA kinase